MLQPVLRRPRYGRVRYHHVGAERVSKNKIIRPLVAAFHATSSPYSISLNRQRDFFRAGSHSISLSWDFIYNMVADGHSESSAKSNVMTYSRQHLILLYPTHSWNKRCYRHCTPCLSKLNNDVHRWLNEVIYASIYCLIQPSPYKAYHTPEIKMLEGMKPFPLLHHYRHWHTSSFKRSKYCHRYSSSFNLGSCHPTTGSTSEPSPYTNQERVDIRSTQ